MTPSSIWNSLAGRPRRTFVICLIGAILANMDQALFGFVLPQIKQEFDWSEVERGWFIAISFVIAGLIITRLGVLSDRIGRKKVFLGSILISSVLVTALKWVPNTLSLFVLRTLGFASGGIQSPITGTIVVESSPSRLRGLTSGILQISYPLGWLIASILVAPILLSYDWRNVFLIGLISLPYFFIVRKFLDESMPKQALKAAEEDKPKVRELFAPQLRRKTIVLFLGEFLHVFAYGTTILLTAYFQEYRGWDPASAIRIVGLTYGIGALGYIVAAFVGEFLISRRSTIIIWSLLGSVFFAILVWARFDWGGTVLVYSLMTIFFYGTTAVKFTFIAENFPPRLRATGVTVAGSLAVNLGVAGGPLAMGYAITHWGWDWAYTICGVAPIFASAFLFLLLKPVPRDLDINSDSSSQRTMSA